MDREEHLPQSFRGILHFRDEAEGPKEAGRRKTQNPGNQDKFPKGRCCQQSPVTRRGGRAGMGGAPGPQLQRVEPCFRSWTRGSVERPALSLPLGGARSLDGQQVNRHFSLLGAAARAVPCPRLQDHGRVWGPVSPPVTGVGSGVWLPESQLWLSRASAQVTSCDIPILLSFPHQW